MNKIILILIFPFFAAVLSYYLGTIREYYRDAFNIGFAGIMLVVILGLFPDVRQETLECIVPNIMGTGIHLKVDMLRYSMIVLSAVAWFFTIMYSSQYFIKKKNRNRYYMILMLTYGFTLGTFMSDNILNLFTFFEGMTLTSYALIINDEDKYSHQAGMSYLAMSIAGGLVLLLGIFLAFDYTATLDISEMAIYIPKLIPSQKYLIATLLLIGFGVKASMFPLHTWLPKSYTSAPAPATAILSAVLLKTGLFGVIITVLEIMNGDIKLSYVILVIGMINMILGGVLAFMQRNIKRIVAYSSMSQTGFILMGIGLAGIMGEAGGIALLGTMIYMLNHGILKLLLFLGVGIIYMVMTELSLNTIWGFGKNKSKLKLVFAVGCLGLVGFPGFNGYISKTLIHESLVEAYHLTHSAVIQASEYVFFLGGALTVAYMIKLFNYVFIRHNNKFTGQYKEQIRKRAVLPLILLSILVFVIGVYPAAVINVLEVYPQQLGFHMPESYHFFTVDALLSSINTMLLGLMLFISFRGLVVRRVADGLLFLNPSLKWVNLEEDLYRPLLLGSFKLLSWIFKFIDTWFLNIVTIVSNLFKKLADLDTAFLVKLEFDRLIIDTSENTYEEDLEEKFMLEEKDNKQAKGERIIKDKIAQTIKKSKEEIKYIGEEISSAGEEIKQRSSKLKDMIYLFHYKGSTITYSVFVLGLVLVISMLIIFMEK